MPKHRILDERTGEPCDYEALTEECRALVENEGLTWRQAAKRVAEAAHSVACDSIVRNLNRYREDHPRSARTAGYLPGEGVLYDVVEEWLGRIEARVSAMVGHDYPQTSDSPYAGVAAEAAQLRTLLERRLKTLQSLPPEDASRGALAVLGGEDCGPITPDKLLQEEHARLGSLFGRVRHLQNRVQDARPGPRIIRDY